MMYRDNDRSKVRERERQGHVSSFCICDYGEGCLILFCFLCGRTRCAGIAYFVGQMRLGGATQKKACAHRCLFREHRVGMSTHKLTRRSSSPGQPQQSAFLVHLHFVLSGRMSGPQLCATSHHRIKKWSVISSVTEREEFAVVNIS